MLDALAADIAVIEEDRQLGTGSALIVAANCRPRLEDSMSEAPGRWVAEIETQVQFFDLDPMEDRMARPLCQVFRNRTLRVARSDRLQLPADENIGLCLAGDRYAYSLH